MKVAVQIRQVAGFRIETRQRSKAAARPIDLCLEDPPHAGQLGRRAVGPACTSPELDGDSLRLILPAANQYPSGRPELAAGPSDAWGGRGAQVDDASARPTQPLAGGRHQLAREQ